jgi:hypothetical protein
VARRKGRPQHEAAAKAAARHVSHQLTIVLAVPRIPRRVRAHLEVLRDEVTALLERNGRR